MTGMIFGVGRRGAASVDLLGTAFFVKPGVFATASHVVAGDDRNLVLAFKPSASIDDYQDTSDTKVQIVPVSLAGVDAFHDLAVLRTEKPEGQGGITIAGADAAPVGTAVSIFGFPHANHGRLVLTRQDAAIGARVLIENGGVKAKHVVLNTQARPGQSGSPVLRQSDGFLVAVLIGSYAPGGGGGISLGGVDPHTLHQTTHAVSAEYLRKMLP